MRVILTTHIVTKQYVVLFDFFVCLLDNHFRLSITLKVSYRCLSSMSTSDYEGAEGIIGRKMVFCPRLNSLKPDELIMTYPDCSGFYLYCCQCSMKHYPNYETMKPCHHFRLVFTDGACPNNGQPGAKAGVGMAYGEHSIAHLAHPVTENLDPKQKRTSQRAELLAAIYGLRLRVAVYEANNLDTEHQSKNPKPNQKASLKSEDQKEKWVIATDSVYVVKGMTEWLPAWKVSCYVQFLPTHLDPESHFDIGAIEEQSSH